MKQLIIPIISLIVLIRPYDIAASTTNDIPFYIYNAASHFGIDAVLMLALCTKESHCTPGTVNKDDARDKKKRLGVKEYSYGLFQIKLSTARGLGFRGTYKELIIPEVNTWYAAKLLSELYGRYHDTIKVLSAYNAGRPVLCNRAYVADILKYYVHFRIDRSL